MNRLDFLVGVAATAGAAASPTPLPWDTWDASRALPYDRPIEIAIELLDAGKTSFKLSQYRGTPVIVNIFATWCEPCNSEQPALVAAAARYAPTDLQFIGIDAGDSDNSVRSYRSKYGITYPIAMDRSWGLHGHTRSRNGRRKQRRSDVAVFQTGRLSLRRFAR